MPLYGELVAVREEGGQFEMVPADTLLNLPPHLNPPAESDAVDVQPAADFLKSSYQLECRTKCQKGREHYAQVVRDYLERSFEARIKKAQERAMLLKAQVGANPEFNLAADAAWKYVEDRERMREEHRAGLKRLEIARTGPIQYVAAALILTPEGGAHA